MRQSRSSRILTALAVAGLAALTLSGCFASSRVVAIDYISALSVPADAAAQGVLVREQLGAGSSDAPAAVVASSATVVNGGSIQQTVSAEAEFSAVRIAVEPLVDDEGDPIDATGTPGFGFWQIDLSAPTTAAVVVLTLPQDLPHQEFVAHVAVVDEFGDQGTPAAQDVEALPVGTGDVQVTVSWDVDSDLDLHVIDPSGAEIYWDALTSSSGGLLDLDSNAACQIDGVRNENVTWPTGTAPPGEYKVLLDLWDTCGQSPTNYVVTIAVAGQDVQTVTGSIDGEGDQGGAGAGTQIAAFQVAD